MTVIYSFSNAELDQIQEDHDSEIGGARYAYRIFHDINSDVPVTTEQVEDFCVAFYSQYNARFGERY